MIECVATIETIRFYKDNFGIIICSIESIQTGELEEGLYKDRVVFKGEMPTPNKGDMYHIKAELVKDPKWGDQYNIISIYSAVSFDTAEGKKRFLASLFTPKQIQNMYDALEDPFTALENKDFPEIVKIKGCGMKTANDWVKKFEDNINLAKIFLELKDYDLTNSMVKKLMDRYRSPDVVVDKVKHNPYVLCTEVRGIGFKKADEIALKGGMDPYGVERISAFIYQYLDLCGDSGQSWITPDHLLGAILDVLGEDVPDEAITNAIYHLDEEHKLWWNDDKDAIGLAFYKKLADNIAEELLRIRNGECNFKRDNWEDAIKRNEASQGWEYTDEQIDAIMSSFDNNVMIITGGAGSGKSSTVSAILDIFKNNSHVLCALSGKASSVLSEYTGEEGFTIHRLLGFPTGPIDKQCFTFHDENQLSYDIVVVDEISMIGAKLFYYLLRSIKTGAKLIMLGDDGQLEAIGCGNVAHDMLISPEIHHNYLTKIHRQASKSGIITESVKVRQGVQLIPKEWAGEEIRGELKDLKLICYSDYNNTFYKVVEEFQKIKNRGDFNLMETQVIVPIKTKGTSCTAQFNNILQEMCNPKTNRKKEVVVNRSGLTQIIREGDKVICKKNNYRVEPNIFNGSTGILRKFGYNDEGEDVWVIDFRGIGTVELPKDYWGDIELNYCGTVHSNQGSQYDYVIVGLDFSSYTLLTRELVYTAITRAKKKCIIVAQNSALRYAVGNKGLSRKQTHLRDSLYNKAHPPLIF